MKLAVRVDKPVAQGENSHGKHTEEMTSKYTSQKSLWNSCDSTVVELLSVRVCV